MPQSKLMPLPVTPTLRRSGSPLLSCSTKEASVGVCPGPFYFASSSSLYRLIVAFTRGANTTISSQPAWGHRSPARRIAVSAVARCGGRSRDNGLFGSQMMLGLGLPSSFRPNLSPVVGRRRTAAGPSPRGAHRWPRDVLPAPGPVGGRRFGGSLGLRGENGCPFCCSGSCTARLPGDGWPSTFAGRPEDTRVMVRGGPEQALATRRGREEATCTDTVGRVCVRHAWTVRSMSPSARLCAGADVRFPEPGRRTAGYDLALL